MENPSFSIIIPVKNAQATLPYLFEALSKQKIKARKIIFVDNDSVDESLGMLENFKKSFAGEVLILAEKKKGPSAARNRAIPYADTEFIGFLDTDVIPPEDWTTNALSFFENHPEFDFVYGILKGYPHKGILFRFQSFYRNDSPKGPAEKKEDIFWQDFIMFSNGACRRSLLQKTGNLDENFYYGEDLDFHLRALQQKAKLYIGYPGLEADHYEKYTFPKFIISRYFYRVALAKIMTVYFKGMLIIRKKSSVVSRRIGFFTVWIGNPSWFLGFVLFAILILFYPALLLTALPVLYGANLFHVLYKGLKRKGYAIGELIIFSFMQTAVVIGLLIAHVFVFFRYFVLMI